MIERFKPYPAYKDSGVPWLGEVPEHWEVKRLRHLFRVLNGATPRSDDDNWHGDIVWVTPEDLGRVTGRNIFTSARRITDKGYRSCGTSIAPPNSLALSTRAPIGHLAITRAPACVNQGCRLLVPRSGVAPEYWYYQLSAARPELESLGQGSTFSELSRSKLLAVGLTQPSIDEASAIVRFLDHADRRIRRYICAKRRLVALLNEQKQAIIHRAVTRGLDPNVRLKPSGVTWLGDLPEHWTVKRLRHVSPSVSVGVVVNPSSYFTEDGVPILLGNNVQPGGFRLDDVRRISEDSNRGALAKSRVRSGDVVVVRVGAPGVSGVIPHHLDGCNVASMMIVRQGPAFVSEWLMYLFNSPVLQSQIDSVKYGAARNVSTTLRVCRARPVNAAGESPVQGSVGTPW